MFEANSASRAREIRSALGVGGDLVPPGVKQCGRPRTPPLILPNLMPLPKLLKKILSKRKASESSPSPDVPAGDEKDTPSQTDTATADGPVPEYSDSLTEAWAVAHQELPLAQGGEKFLNKIGTSFKGSRVHTFLPCGNRRCALSIQH